jgi:cytochrome c-type biogenesis protein CcmE
VVNEPRPEMLRHEAQAILSGKLGADGVFYATELQFKCPSRFEESGPVMGEEDHPGMDVISG